MNNEKISDIELQSFIDESESSLFFYKEQYKKAISEKEKVILFYSKRIKKLQKKILHSEKGIDLNERRLLEFKKIRGDVVEQTSIKKEIKKEKPNHNFVINPITGDVIELSEDELKNLLER